MTIVRRCNSISSHIQRRRPSGPQFKIWANVDHSALGAVATTNIWFGVGAPADRFVIPKLSEPWRADELWKSTCFEAFLRADGTEALSRVEFRAVGKLGRL